MQVAWLAAAQQPLQVDLARGRVEQIGAAHHVADRLRGIVHHHGELIGELAVGAVEDEVADLRRKDLLLRALDAVMEEDLLRPGIYPQCACGFTLRQPASACARVDLRPVGGHAC